MYLGGLIFGESMNDIALNTVSIHKMYCDCMNINLKLTGVAEEIVDEMIKKGYAASKTEAIRIAILDYKHHHLEGDRLTKEDLLDLQEALREHKEGKSIPLDDV